MNKEIYHATQSRFEHFVLLWAMLLLAARKCIFLLISVPDKVAVLSQVF